MAHVDNEYFTDVLDTLNEYQDRHGQRLSSKKLREAVRLVMDEEEEEMEHNINNISDSKEGVDDINDSKEGVEDRDDSFEEVDVLNDSENFVVDESDPKSDPNGATHTINGIFSSDTTNGILTRKLFPLFIKPAIKAIETRCRAIFGSPKFVDSSIFSTRIRDQDIFSPSDSSIARRGRNAEPFDASINQFSAVNGHYTSYLSSVSSAETVSA